MLAGQTVGRIEATDNDIGSNGEVVYGLQRDPGTDDELFNVDPENGLLSANVNLRHGIRDNSTIYSLIVTASNPSQGRRAGQGHSVLTRSILRVILDRPVMTSSLGTRGRQSFVFNGHSMVAIVTVGAVSAVVIVVLLVAIAIVLCRQRRRTKDLMTSAQYDAAPTDASHDDVIHQQLTSLKTPLTALHTANDVTAARPCDATIQLSTRSRDIEVSSTYVYSQI